MSKHIFHSTLLEGNLTIDRIRKEVVKVIKDQAILSVDKQTYLEHIIYLIGVIEQLAEVNKEVDYTRGKLSVIDKEHRVYQNCLVELKKIKRENVL
jgi:hypothetical protein